MTISGGFLYALFLTLIIFLIAHVNVDADFFPTTKTNFTLVVIAIIIISLLFVLF